MRAGWRYCVRFVPSSSTRHCGGESLRERRCVMALGSSSSSRGGSTNAAVLFRRASTHRTGDEDMKETAPLTGALPFSPSVVRSSSCFVYDRPSSLVC